MECIHEACKWLSFNNLPPNTFHIASPTIHTAVATPSALTTALFPYYSVTILSEHGRLHEQRVRTHQSQLIS